MDKSIGCDGWIAVFIYINHLCGLDDAAAYGSAQLAIVADASLAVDGGRTDGQ